MITINIGSTQSLNMGTQSLLDYVVNPDATMTTTQPRVTQWIEYGINQVGSLIHEPVETAGDHAYWDDVISSGHQLHLYGSGLDNTTVGGNSMVNRIVMEDASNNVLFEMLLPGDAQLSLRELANIYITAPMDTGASLIANMLTNQWLGETITINDGGLGNTINGDALIDILNGNGGNDKLNGNGGNDTLNGGLGNDTLTGGAGADRVLGAGGNDTFIWATGDTLLDGGAGTDILRVNGAGQTLNLTTIANSLIKNTEVINITGTGNNTLRVNLNDVLALSSTTDELRVDGNAGDKVVALNGAGTWADGGVSGAYHLYTQGMATLRIDSDITVQFV